MTYGVTQTRRFARAYKKLHDNVAADVDATVADIAANPSLGERKKGDLADLPVHKFRSRGQLYLLGYTVDEQVRLICLEAVGPIRTSIGTSSAEPQGAPAGAAMQ